MMWTVVLLTAVVAGTVQTITGFGAGIFLIMVLSHYVDMFAAPAINTAICTGLTIVMSVKYRRHINLRLVALPLAFYVLVSTSVIRSVKSIDLRLLGVGFGAFLIVLGLYFAFFSDRVSVRPTPAAAVGCGVISGLFSGLFGLGGPPIGLYFSSVTQTHEEYLANTQFLFTVSNFFSTAVRVSKGIYTPDFIPLTLAGMVAVNVGQLIGTKVFRRLSAKSLNRLLYLFIGISGVITLLRNLL